MTAVFVSSGVTPADRSRRSPRRPAWALALALLVSVLLAGTATGSGHRSVDKPRIVRWHIVGDAGIGYSRARVEQVYGASETVPVTRGTYYQSGELEVAYSADYNQRATVTVIRTRSPRYRTSDGFGVGSRVPFRKTWNGFTRYVSPESGYFLYRYVTYGGRPLTVVIHVVQGAVDHLSIYRGKADIARITLPGDPYYRKGPLPVPVVGEKPS